MRERCKPVCRRGAAVFPGHISLVDELVINSDEKHSFSLEKVLMSKIRLAKPVAVVGGLIFLCAAPGLTRAQSAPPASVQAQKVASTGAQVKRDSLPADDFAGLNYSEEQKTEIDRIQRSTKALMDTVVKDNKLTADQKDAMLLGYKRIEYGQVYQVLTPEQQKQVRQRIQARRAEKQTAQAR